MNISDMKKWIDEASYQQLLTKWRNDPTGSPWFIGEVGDYYTEKMTEKKNAITSAEAVAASKNVGWDK